MPQSKVRALDFIKLTLHLNSPSLTLALTLTRPKVRALDFIKFILEELDQNREKPMSECVYSAYERSLRPYHGFVVRVRCVRCVRGMPL